jgi:hypothetical protein
MFFCFFLFIQKSVMTKRITNFLTILSLFFLVAACNEHGPAAVVNNDSDKTTSIQEQAPCPSGPMYSDSFDVAFIRSGACGTLKDVEFVKAYNGQICAGQEKVVDMSKYVSFDFEELCGTYKIYRYKKKGL